MFITSPTRKQQAAASSSSIKQGGEILTFFELGRLESWNFFKFMLGFEDLGDLGPLMRLV